MNLVPTNYPFIYVGDLERWVSEDFYEIYDAIGHAKFVNSAFDLEYAAVFVTRKFKIPEDKDKNYAILVAEIGVVGDDIYLHTIEYLGACNYLPLVALGDVSGQNLAGKTMKIHPRLKNYQQYERFYVGQQEVVSSLKRYIGYIVHNEWYKHDLIKPF